MPWFNVDLKLLPIKAHYFLLQGGTAPFTPFLTTIAKQRGYSAFLVGIIFATLPILTVFSRLMFGAITDRFSCQKKAFLWSIVIIILVNTSYGFLPDTPVNIDNNADDHTATVLSTLSTYQFWLFCIFLISRSISLNVVVTLSDTICLQTLGDDKHKYGKQRVWGSVGWGVVSAFTGWLIDWYSYGQLTKDYMPGLFVSVAFMFTDLLVAFKINDYQSNVVPKNIFKDLGKVLCDIKVASFLIWVIFFGIFHSSITLYMVWHMEELVSKYYPEKYSSIKTFQGTLFAVKCFGGAVPFMILSGKIIKKVGHINSMLIGFFSMSVRFLIYFVIENPVWMLPVELLTGLNYSLPYSSMIIYSGIIAPDGLKGTVQGLVGTAFSGIGVSLGSLTTGYLFKKIGTSETYFVLSILALAVCLLQFLTIQLMAKKTNPKTEKTLSVKGLCI